MAKTALSHIAMGKVSQIFFANNLLDPRNKDSSLELILIKDQPDG